MYIIYLSYNDIYAYLWDLIVKIYRSDLIDVNLCHTYVILVWDILVFNLK